LEHTGIEPGRVQFSWISSAESTKFVDVVKNITDEVKSLNPDKKYMKTEPKVE